MAYLELSRVSPIISDFAAAEVASAISLKKRMGRVDDDRAHQALARFDAWRANVASPVDLTAADVRVADAFVRRMDLPLRAPDAIHLAIATRLGVELATFDTQMARSAEALGVALAAL